MGRFSHLPGRESHGAKALGWALTGQSWPSPALAAGWENKAGREEGSDPRQAAGGGGAGQGGGGTQGLGPLHPSQTLPGCSRGSPLNPLPSQLAVQGLLLSQVLCLMPNHVLHPQPIVQQASVGLPPSSLPSWLGTWGPVTVSKD